MELPEIVEDRARRGKYVAEGDKVGMERERALMRAAKVARDAERARKTELWRELRRSTLRRLVVSGDSGGDTLPAADNLDLPLAISSPPDAAYHLAPPPLPVLPTDVAAAAVDALPADDDAQMKDAKLDDPAPLDVSVSRPASPLPATLPTDVEMDDVLSRRTTLFKCSGNPGRRTYAEILAIGHACYRPILSTAALVDEYFASIFAPEPIRELPVKVSCAPDGKVYLAHAACVEAMEELEGVTLEDKIKATENRRLICVDCVMIHPN